MTVRVPAIKVLLLPKDTNALGTIFGGVILVDGRAAEARRVAPHRYVTKAMREAPGTARHGNRPNGAWWPWSQMRPGAGRGETR